ncbi:MULTISPECIES: hypothetical protein [unclassified Hydrogenobaculum]|uniref:hypothetical protein n=1 Tax=unclassified Hydrogenobaculum TaxID=2622382 RepID=UPI0001C52AD0|nr:MULTISPECIES: hypothetical protein [unclassified Hydrogenobaculum]
MLKHACYSYPRTLRPTSMPRFHYSLGYRTPAGVAYKYATVNGNGIKNSEVVP